MAKCHPGGTGPNDVQDQDAFQEACAVFGESDALARLLDFRRDLVTHLSRIAQGPLDNETLRDIAHRTAGRAGVLGFPALTEACASLEDAARRDTGVASAVALWKEQAFLAARIPAG